MVRGKLLGFRVHSLGHRVVGAWFEGSRSDGLGFKDESKVSRVGLEDGEPVAAVRVWGWGFGD